jgi:hypothetical protein
MPSSKNRRHIEIPVSLHERLHQEAARRDTTVTGLATQLLTAALDDGARRRTPKHSGPHRFLAWLTHR